MSLECKVNGESFEAGKDIKLVVKVTVNNHDEAQSLKGGFLRVDIKGEEYACVHWTDSSSEDHFERESKTIFSQARVLKEYQNAESIGIFEYTYEYHLHKRLPSSFNLDSGHNQCEIRYGMQVTLKKGHGDDQMWKFPFQVHANPASAVPSQTERFLLPEQQQIKMCCLFNRGTMTVGACLSKSIVRQHDTFNLSFAVLNDSLVKINKVEVGLFETAHFESKKKRAHKKTVLVMREFDTNDIPEAQKVKKVDKTISPEKQAEKILRILASTEHESGKKTLVFALRPDTNESFMGKKIRVRHSIHIRVVTGGAFSNPEMKTFLKILPCGRKIKEFYLKKASLEHHGGHQSKVKLITEDDDKDEEEEILPELEVNAVDDKFLVPSSSKLVEGNSNRTIHVEPDETIGFKKTYPATYEGLMQAMDETLEDLILLEKYISDEKFGFRDILANLTPQQFGTVVSSVDYGFDQSSVASMLQELMGPKFTCEHVATAVRMCPEKTRSEVVRATGRKAVDFEQNRHVIASCLSKMDEILLDTI